MRFSYYRSQLASLKAKRNGYLILALGGMGFSFLLLLLVFILIGREKVVVVPPTVEKSFWVSKSSVSPEYLAEMAHFLAYLRLNATPSSLDEQVSLLLGYTHPRFYNVLKAQLVKEKERINHEHITTAFYPSETKVDTHTLKALIKGELKTNVGEASLPSRPVTYLITFQYEAWRLLVTSFEEVKEEGSHA